MTDGWGEQDHENRGRLSRVIITKVDDSGNQQLIDYDGVKDEQHTNVVRLQAFGYSNNPPAGAEGVVLALNSRDAPMLIGIEHPDHKPKGLPSGGSRLYDSKGSYVDLDAAGNISHVSATSISITTATLKIKANVEITGDIKHTGKMTSSGDHTAPAFHGVADSDLGV